jgi:hypothetical protein
LGICNATFSCPSIPPAGFDDVGGNTETFVINRRQVGLRRSIAEFGRLAKPLDRFSEILWNATAGLVHHPQVILRAGVPALGHQLVETRFGRVVAFLMRVAKAHSPDGTPAS